MRLYHGTSEPRLPAILKAGLRPRGESGKHNWEHTIPSNPDAVYLTTAYAPYFAFQSADNEERIVIFEIDTDLLDESRLCPDEDFLEQATRDGDREEMAKLMTQSGYRATGHPEWGGLGMKERTVKYREVMLSEYGSKWAFSIENLGTCAYVGTVPTKAIVRYAVYDALNTKNSVYEVTASLTAPSIVLANYRIMGSFYRKLTAWFFGGKMTYADIRLLNLHPGSEEQLMAQDREIWMHNSKMSEADYTEMVAETDEHLAGHRGLEVYVKDGKRFRLSYRDGKKFK